MNITEIEIKDLRDIAMFLEGMKLGRGDLLPLGIQHLESLWQAIRRLQKEKK